MNTSKVRLDLYDNSWFSTGAGAIKRILWYVINCLFLINPLNPSSGLKVRLLRVFGASIGTGVVIKPGVNVKYPWRLSIADYVWIGEGVWIDNLGEVKIGSHVCISQGAMLLTGNHNYKSQKFDLIVKPIVLENGCWLGAKSVICPGVNCGSHAVLAVGSIATTSLLPWTVYQGNPAVKIRTRELIL